MILIAMSAEWPWLEAEKMRHLLGLYDPHLTPVEIGERVRLIRKTLHVLVYGLLGWAAAWAVALGRRKPRWLVALAAISAVTVTAVADELHQSTVPGRTAEVADVLRDLSGGLVAITAYLLSRKTRKRRRVYY